MDSNLYLEIHYIYFVLCLGNVNFHTVVWTSDTSFHTTQDLSERLSRLVSKPFLKVISAFNSAFSFYQDLDKGIFFRLLDLQFDAFLTKDDH